MNNDNDFLKFDDLFEKDKEQNSPVIDETSPKKYGLIILTYFVVFFLIATLISLFFVTNKNNFEKKTATEQIIEILTYESGISFASIDDFNNTSSKDDVNFLKFSEYVIIFSKDLNEEDLKKISKTELVYKEHITDLFNTETSFIKINNLDEKNFLEVYSLNDNVFDSKYKEDTLLKVTVSALINFLTYIIATTLLLIIGYKIFIGDFKRLDKKFTILISAILIGYLYMMLGNLISNVLSMVLRNATNTKDSTSLNQLAINKILKSNSALLMILPTVIFAPIIEELVFRKAFFGIIKKEKLALVASSILFGLIHVIGEVTLVDFFINLIVYSAPGVMLGIIYLKNNKNIFIPILVHSLSNLISVIAILILF